MPKISVIVPVYGVEKYLKEAVDSILNQTMTDLEIILIDDGGKDSCPKIIDEYAEKDSRIIPIHKPNGGYGQTCNIGLERATGEYVAILEPDDYIDKDMYEDLYKVAKENNSDVVKSSFYDNLQSETKVCCKRIEWIGEEQIPRETFKIEECPLFLSYHPSVWTCLYKREFLNKNKIRFIEAPGAGWTDNPFQVQTMCLAERINYVSKAYYYWRRFHENDADSLKDYTLPFKRSDEIHDWLSDYNIDNQDILACLFCREIGYIKLVLNMLNLKNCADAFKRIKMMLKRMDDRIIYDNPYSEDWEKKLYSKIKHNLFGWYLNTCRKRIISMCFNKDVKYIKFMGKVILGKEE